MTVKVKIPDKEKYENEPQRSRTNKENSGVDDFIGSKLIKNPAKAILPGRILTAAPGDAGPVPAAALIVVAVALAAQLVPPPRTLALQARFSQLAPAAQAAGRQCLGRCGAATAATAAATAAWPDG